MLTGWLAILIGVGLVVLAALGLTKGRDRVDLGNFGKYSVPAGFGAGLMFIVVGTVLAAA